MGALVGKLSPRARKSETRSEKFAAHCTARLKKVSSDVGILQLNGEQRCSTCSPLQRADDMDVNASEGDQSESPVLGQEIPVDSEGWGTNLRHRLLMWG